MISLPTDLIAQCWRLSRRGTIAALLFWPLLVGGLAACSEDRVYATPAFYSGHVVKTKIGGHVGMVIAVSCPQINGKFGRPNAKCTYDVRFGTTELSTNTRTLGADDPITYAPISRVRYIHEFELESAQ